MILTLYISKELPGLYSGRICLSNDELLIEYTSDTIANAIEDAAKEGIPDVAGFHTWYEGVCLGSVHCDEMLSDPESLAQRALQLRAMFAE